MKNSYFSEIHTQKNPVRPVLESWILMCFCIQSFTVSHCRWPLGNFSVLIKNGNEKGKSCLSVTKAILTLITLERGSRTSPDHTLNHCPSLILYKGAASPRNQVRNPKLHGLLMIGYKSQMVCPTFLGLGSQLKNLGNIP